MTSGGVPRRPEANPFAGPSRPPAPGRRPGWYRPRRRPPGPLPVTYQPPWTPSDPDDDYEYDHYDPREELREQPVLSTRDVAELCGVRPAAVRQWITRGHLTPSGASHIFDTTAVLAAAHLIPKPRQATRKPSRPEHPKPRAIRPPQRRPTAHRVGTMRGAKVTAAPDEKAGPSQDGVLYTATTVAPEAGTFPAALA